MDFQNGGFTVFAQVLDDGMDVVDAIAAIPTYNAGEPFSDLPLDNYSSGPVTLDNLVAVRSVTLFPTFQIALSHPDHFTFDEADGVLTISSSGRAVDSATVTVIATSIDGSTASANFNILISDLPHPASFSGRIESRDPSVAHPVGLLHLTRKKSGTFSGSLTFGTTKHPLRGRFDQHGSVTLQLNKGTLAGGVLTLGTSPTESPSLAGHIEIGGTTHPVTATLAPYSGKRADRHPLDGMSYALGFEAPASGAGHGYATLKVNRKGVARLIGRTGDGNRLRSSNRLGSDSAFNLFIASKDATVVAGSISLEDGGSTPGAADLNGEILWHQSQNGQEDLLDVLGEQFSSDPLLNAVGVETPFTLNSPGRDPIEGFWPTRGHPVLTALTRSRLRYSKRHGTLTGKIADPSIGPLRLSAIVFPEPLTFPSGSHSAVGFISGQENEPLRLTLP